MDDIMEVRGVSVAEVRAVGTAEDGQAYVDCRFADDSTGLIAFHYPSQGLETGEQVMTLTFEGGKRFNFLLPPHCIEQLAWEVCEIKRAAWTKPPLVN